MEHDSHESVDWVQQVRDYLQFQVDQGLGVLMTEAPAASDSTEPLPGPQEEDSARALRAVREELGDCTRCPLHRNRANIVFGEGNPEASLMFVGEGPGADEDRLGKPFVGRAGRLLERMIIAMTLERSDVYIANIVKCRPPGNRDPQPDEIKTCFPFLEAQISSVRPEVIVALGRCAAHTLLDTREALTRLRGRFHERKGVLVMPTYHPSFLLRYERDRRKKGEAWSDLKQVMAHLDIPVPGAGAKS